MYDVVLVGYGPVAEVLAVMLGRQGRRVAIFEKWTERYGLPRAVCIDHEIYRVLSAIGMGDELPAASHPAPQYRWFSADWQELLGIDWAAESISGGPEVHFVHQPTLEAMFDAHVRAQPTVTVNLGWEVKAVSQTPDYAELTALERASGTVRTVRARYIIGCDGANSLVRQAIGGGLEDRGFEADWLVVDLLPHEGVTLDVPGAAQWCNPARPTTIVPAGIRDGRYYRRWEFMRLPGETVADLESETRAWELLAPWVMPAQATIVRHKVYTFRSLLAERWRNGRLLIAGDAAHVMPPFMGQGMCSGLRDDFNLVWKLNLVLDGHADASLLDTYQTERAPHVSDIIDMSMFLGKIICQPDPALAAQRDSDFLEGRVPPPSPFPHLTAGLVDPAAPAAGRLSPHGPAERRGQAGRYDDLVGTGHFVLVAADTQLLDGLSTAAQAAGQPLGLAYAALAGPADDPRVVADTNGKFRDFLAQHDIRAMLVRPDFHLFGGAPDAPGASALVLHLAQQLAAHAPAGQAVAA